MESIFNKMFDDFDDFDSFNDDFEEPKKKSPKENKKESKGSKKSKKMNKEEKKSKKETKEVAVHNHEVTKQQSEKEFMNKLRKLGNKPYKFNTTYCKPFDENDKEKGGITDTYKGEWNGPRHYHINHIRTM